MRLAELSQGRVVLIFFGFTRCPEVCPTTMLALQRAYEKPSPTEQERVQVLFIRVDPELDTPPTPHQYAKGSHPSFLGTPGTPEP
ncbi:SCO family protein, partial [Thermus scotoductus]|uniref:SCO family protein n=1 Tax=Thermus scotoductus TaxID=37636 RepID=UPI0010040360